jgi:hypothetical protein
MSNSVIGDLRLYNPAGAHACLLSYEMAVNDVVCVKRYLQQRHRHCDGAGDVPPELVKHLVLGERSMEAAVVEELELIPLSDCVASPGNGLTFVFTSYAPALSFVDETNDMGATFQADVWREDISLH